MKNKILHISYSKFWDKPQIFNTVETYQLACDLGYDAIKGDVAVTCDNKLVMCHDSYFKFDEDGRVFDSLVVDSAQGEQKEIIDMTYDKCMALEYNTPEAKAHLGYYSKVAGLEDLLQVCKENGKIAYITARDLKIKEITEEIYRLLVKYDMVEQCIINSFNYETLETMRSFDSRLFLSQVHGPNTIPTYEEIDRIAKLGKAAICYFWFKDKTLNEDFYNQSKASIAYAKQKGLELHFAHAWDKETYELGVQRGFTGFQCANADVI